MDDNNDPTEAMLASTGTVNSGSSGGESLLSRIRAIFNPRGYSAVPNDKIKPYQEWR